MEPSQVDLLKQNIVDVNEVMRISNNETESMKNICIYVPEIYLKTLEKLSELRVIENRSDGIRIAVKELLERDANTRNNLENLLKENLEK
jgi:hypothetical protein